MLELKLGAPIYRQIDVVAVNGESPASDYGEVVVEWPGSISEVDWCRSTAKLSWSWRNGVGPRWGGRTGMTAAESMLRALRFTTRVAARSGEWKATRRAPVAWAALGGAVSAAPLSGGRKAAAGVGHGAAHLL